MEYQFSDRIANMTGNAIRDIFKLLAKPSVISFAGGMPAKDALPVEEIRRITDKVLSENGATILQYGATEAYAPLGESAAVFLTNMAGFPCTKDEIFIISGGQQGIDLACKAFLNKGDCILVERPTFLGALQIMNTYEANIISVEMDEDGIILEALEENAKKYSPKLVYTVPTFQNPTGRTMALNRRKRMLELADKYNFFIIEDDPYCQLRYSGKPLPSIKSMDSLGRVIYLTSFSKIISPGLRTGIAAAAPLILRKMIIGKQATDVHTSTLSQAIVDAFLREGILEEHIKKSNIIHKERMDKMMEMLDKTFPKDVQYTRPEGGLFIWAELPEGIDATEMLAKATARDVAYIPGTHFYAEGGHPNTIRLNFSNSSLERIERGMTILSEVIKQEIKK